MGRKPVSVIVLILLLIGALALAFNTQPAKAEPGTIYVDDDNTGGPWDGSPGHPYQNITSALQHASVDDTIYVYNGVYRENVVIDKTLTLMGESRSNTIINGSGLLNLTGALVAIAAANNVDISGFTVTNALHQGINAGDSWYCVVHDTIVCFTGEGDGDRGIVFGGGGNNSAYNNVVYNSTGFGGIEAIYSDNNTIYNNLAYFNQWGIATNHGSYNRIYNNTVHSNRVGIHIDWPSTGNIIHNNDVSSNTNTGIRVINHANENIISGNKISENYCGIQLVNSPRNNISGNYIINSEAAVALISSENNSFYHNNFINNGWQVYIEPPSCINFWDDGYPHGGNYWSDYTGVDLYSGPYQNETGSDGIGDVPYTINANNTDNYPLMRALYYESGMTQAVSTESTDGSYHPSLAVDSAGNVHIAWHDQTDLDCGNEWDIFYKRFVAGSGWTPTEVVSTESNGTSAYPSLAVDSNGNVHVAWHDNTTDYAGSGTDWDIFYKRYEVGVGWTDTEVVSTNSTEDSYDASLAVDSAGNVHIAWHDETPYDGSRTDWDIFYKRYEVGVGWTDTEVVSTESRGNSFRASLAVDSAGNVHIAWDDESNYAGSGNDADIFYKRYEVGVGWTDTEVVSTGITLGSYDASLAVDSAGNVHIAWHDDTDYAGSGTDRDIFYKRYEVGVGWTDTEVVSTESNTDSWVPSLAVDSTGNVHVAWDDRPESNWTVFYKRYEVGLNWTKTQVVSTESTANSWVASLAVDSSRNIHVAWHDETEYAGCGSDADIFYKYLRLHSTQYPWPMFQHNPTHTGYTESPAPNTNQTMWNYTTSGWVESSPVVADGIVFVGSDDGNVYALDQHTGAKIWNYTTGWPVYSSPAVAYGKVYVAAFYQKVFCLDAVTGAHIWNYTTGGWMRSSPAVVDGKVYVGSDGGGVYCLNASTGAQIWNYPIGSWTYTSSPAVAYGKVYVGSIDDKVYCIDATTGAHIWNYTTDGDVRSSPAVAYGKVYVGSYDNKVYCIDATTGAHIWNYTTDGDVHSSPAVAYGKVYVGSTDGKVYCLNASTRAHIWNRTTGSSVFSSPAVADGMVYVGSFDNKTYCLNASTGIHIWNYTTGDHVYSSPAVADGIVFIGSNDGKVYAFGNILRVPEDYPTIQEAIDAATPGATISIAPGTYHESLVIDQPGITILGRKGSSTDFAGNATGIAVTIINTSEVTVANVIITNWEQGVFIDNSSACQIYANTMYYMGDSGIALEGNNAANNVIDSNKIYSNNIAINIAESSTSNTIYNNTISLNSIGLNLESSGNTIYANTISANDLGINMSNSIANTIYWNNFINPTQVHIETYGDANIWDNGYPSGGNYWSDYKDKYPEAMEWAGSGIWDTPYAIDEYNVDNYPLMNPIHEITVTKVTPYKTVVGQGCSLKINVTVANQGRLTETFKLTLYANATVITQLTNIFLASRNSKTITFTWNTIGVPYGNYIISAKANVVPGETYTADNTYVYGWVIVTITSDVDGDKNVDAFDLFHLSKAYESTPSKPNWNPNCDLNDDNKVDASDLDDLKRDYGKTNP